MTCRGRFWDGKGSNVNSSLMLRRLWTHTVLSSSCSAPTCYRLRRSLFWRFWRSWCPECLRRRSCRSMLKPNWGIWTWWPRLWCLWWRCLRLSHSILAWSKGIFITQSLPSRRFRSFLRISGRCWCRFSSRVVWRWVFSCRKRGWSPRGCVFIVLGAIGRVRRCCSALDSHHSISSRLIGNPSRVFKGNQRRWLMRVSWSLILCFWLNWGWVCSRRWWCWVFWCFWRHREVPADVGHRVWRFYLRHQPSGRCSMSFG